MKSGSCRHLVSCHPCLVKRNRVLSDSGILAYPVCTCRQANLSSLVVPPGIDLNTTTVTEMVVAVITSQVAEEPGAVLWYTGVR